MNPTLSEEFRVRIDSKKDLIFAAIVAVLIVLPAIIVLLLLNMIGDYIDLSGFGLRNMVIRWLIMSIIIAAVGLSSAFFPKGSKPRLILCLSMRILAVATLWIVTSGGTIEMDLTEGLSSMMGDTGDLNAKITIGLVVFNVILSLLIMLKCLVHMGEYQDCRQEYLDKYFGGR